MKFTIEDYLEAKRLGMPYAGREASKKTLTTYHSAFDLVEEIVGRPVTALRAEDVPTLLGELDRRGYSTSTKNTVVSAARGLFSWGLDLGLTKGTNPFRGVVTKAAVASIPHVIDEADVVRLTEAAREVFVRKRYKVPSNDPRRRFDWFENDPSEKYVLLIKLLFYGGLRINEALNLRRENVHDEGVVVLGKGSRERFIPLKDELMEELKAFMVAHDASDYVFYGESSNSYAEDKPLAYPTFNAAFKDAVIQAGLDPNEVTPHTLRHSFATHAIEKTGDLAFVQDMLGHANPMTTRRYAQVRKAHARKQYDSLWD